MRTRRIENEWSVLEALQQANPGRLQLARMADSFTLEITGLAALRKAPLDPAQPGDSVACTQSLRVVFPRYYPAMPVEVYLGDSVFHPNVHPDTGFVCLWTRHRIPTTIEQTIAQLQRVLSWALFNSDTEHVMQPAALLWYQQPGVRDYLPLISTPFVPVNNEAWMRPSTSPLRRRLS